MDNPPIYIDLNSPSPSRPRPLPSTATATAPVTNAPSPRPGMSFWDTDDVDPSDALSDLVGTGTGRAAEGRTWTLTSFADLARLPAGSTFAGGSNADDPVASSSTAAANAPAAAPLTDAERIRLRDAIYPGYEYFLNRRARERDPEGYRLLIEGARGTASSSSGAQRYVDAAVGTSDNGAGSEDTADAPSSLDPRDVTLSQILGIPPPLTPPTRSPETMPMRRTTARRYPPFSALGTLGMSWPNGQIGRERDTERERERESDRRERIYPWSNAVATARRAGYGGEGDGEPTAAAGGTPGTAARAGASGSERRGAISEGRRGATRRDTPAESSATPSTNAPSDAGGNPEAGPGPSSTASRIPSRLLNVRPQPQIVPTTSHFSWASYPGREAGSINERMATTVLRRRRDEREERGRERERETDSNNNRAGVPIPPRRDTQVYRYDPNDIAPPGGADDHIWDILGEADDDDDDDDMWGMFRGNVPVGALGSADMLAPIGIGANSLPDLDLDGWGTPPDAGAPLTRGRFNRRRRSVRQRSPSMSPSRNLPPEPERPTETSNVRDHREGSRLGSPDFIDFAPARHTWPATNNDDTFEPFIVTEHGTRQRTRRRDDADLDPDLDLAGQQGRTKRPRASPPPAHPSYVAYTTLPESALLPNDFAQPSTDSNLDVSVEEHGAYVDDGIASRVVVTYSHRAGRPKDRDGAWSLRANRPIPHGIGVHYFEVEVLNDGAGVCDMSVGWMTARPGLQTLVGWDQGSWGWHADDGMTFAQSGEGSTSLNETWQALDTVGAGIDFVTRRAFFTKNGKLVGNVFSDLPDDLHPSVGMRSPHESLAVNFSGPFKYDIDGHARRMRDQVQAFLLPTRLPFITPAPVAAIPRIAAVKGTRVRAGDEEGVPMDVENDDEAISTSATAGTFDPTPAPPQANDTLAVPADSPLAAGSARAQAALVLDHLATTGAQRTHALLVDAFRRRGWLASADAREPAAPALAASVTQLTQALAKGTIDHALLHRLDPRAQWAEDKPLARRLRVYDFAAAASAAASAAHTRTKADARAVDTDEAMDVDTDKSAHSHAIDAADMDTDASDAASDTSDADTRVLALGRDLRRAARDEEWGHAETELLDHAGALLVPPALGAVAALKAAREGDAVVLEARMRDILGLKAQSLLHVAVAQTGLVHEALTSLRDGEAAFVGLQTVLGKAQRA